MSRRLTLPVEALSKDTQKFYDVLNDQPDVVVIVVAASYLDSCLAAILERLLIKSRVSDCMLDVQGGVLGSFSARSDACYVLGLIEKPIYQDLKRVGEIRNEVAHHYLALTFDSARLLELCSGLRYITSINDLDTGKKLFHRGFTEVPRLHFVWTAVMISQRLLLTALEVKRVAIRKGVNNPVREEFSH